MIKRIKTSSQTKTSHIQLAKIERSHLDFDKVHVCQVTMQTYNVFCCLICGKFLAGKHKGSPVEEHAVREDHLLFMDLQDGEVYSIPDGAVVKSKSLEDVKVGLFYMTRLYSRCFYSYKMDQFFGFCNV